MRTSWVNQAFRFVEGIWLHRKSRQIHFFRQRPILLQICTTCSELPSCISTMVNIMNSYAVPDSCYIHSFKLRRPTIFLFEFEYFKAANKYIWNFNDISDVGEGYDQLEAGEPDREPDLGPAHLPTVTVKDGCRIFIRSRSFIQKEKSKKRSQSFIPTIEFLWFGMNLRYFIIFPKEFLLTLIVLE